MACCWVRSIIDNGASGGKTLTNIMHRVFKPYATPNCPFQPAGALFYGPPGSGKSAATRFLMQKTGVCPVWFGTLAELKRPHVGETEAQIRNLLARCREFPHLLCCIGIEEIDSMTPDRDQVGCFRLLRSLAEHCMLMTRCPALLCAVCMIT
jgi:AAA+ superfamily predicted ATPase